MLEHPPVSRIRRSRNEWQALVNDCVNSGLSPQQFCQQKQLNYHRFKIWQRKLDAATFDGMFVEIPQQASRSASWTIELTLGDLTLKLNR
jgi:hypothetical protein